MANTIILKKSSTASAVPAAASLQPGELAINLADKKLYSKTTGGTVIQVGFGDLTSSLVTTALGYTPLNAGIPQQGGESYLTTYDFNSYPPLYNVDFINAGTATNAPAALGGSMSYRFIMGAGDVASRGFDLVGYTGGMLMRERSTGTWWTTAHSGNFTSFSLSSSQVTTALGYTPYNSTNPNGYTSNTGTVTSVSGTGTVSGLTLSGTVTGSGSLTLGGTLSLTSGNVTTALGFTPTYITAQGAVQGQTAISNTVQVVGSTGSAADNVGYRGLPANAKTAAYTLVIGDSGKMITITTGGVTIPSNAAVAFPIGTTIVVYNDSAASQTIAITTDTMYLAGTATTGTRTLAQRGLATLVKVASTTWVISGAGVT